MSTNMGRTLSPEYAGPAFYNSPSASALPIPNFSKRSSTVSGASSDSGSFCTKSKWVSFTSDTNSQNGERAISATQERNKSTDMKPKTTLTVSAHQSPAFEKLAKRMREGNVAQVKRKTVQHQKSKVLKLKQRQQAIIDRIEQVPAKVFTGCTPWEMHDIRDQKSQQSHEMWQLAANNLLLLERSTNHLLQLATQRLQEDLAEQKEILQQRLNGINEQIKEEEDLAGEEMGLTSSKLEDSLASTDKEINNNRGYQNCFV